MGKTIILFWLLPLCIILHNFEEFVFPGGFIDWYKRYKPEIKKSINPRILAITNILLVFGALNPVLNGENIVGVIAWLAFASIAGINIFFHLKGTFLSREYSPGLITSIILYLPLTFYGYYYFLSTKHVSWVVASACTVVGIFTQLFLNFNHKRRTRILDMKQAENGKSSIPG